LIKDLTKEKKYMNTILSLIEKLLYNKIEFEKIDSKKNNNKDISNYNIFLKKLLIIEKLLYNENITEEKFKNYIEENITYKKKYKLKIKDKDNFKKNIFSENLIYKIIALENYDCTFKYISWTKDLNKWIKDIKKLNSVKLYSDSNINNELIMNKIINKQIDKIIIQNLNNNFINNNSFDSKTFHLSYLYYDKNDISKFKKIIISKIKKYNILYSETHLENFFD